MAEDLDEERAKPDPDVDMLPSLLEQVLEMYDQLPPEEQEAFKKKVQDNTQY